MPSTTTLELVAEILVRRVVEECAGADRATLRFALDSACPFADLKEGHAIWRKAVRTALNEMERPSEKKPQSITGSHRNEQASKFG